jgi:hypothetical protein
VTFGLTSDLAELGVMETAGRRAGEPGDDRPGRRDSVPTETPRTHHQADRAGDVHDAEPIASQDGLEGGSRR